LLVAPLAKDFSIQRLPSYGTCAKVLLPTHWRRNAVPARS
jgi:hypothetical protein